jgi:hypothetical protein
MSKVKNYINYIANDILKKDIKIDGSEIIFPWMMEDLMAHYNDPGRVLVFFKHTVTEMKPWEDDEKWYPNDMTIFREYVKAKYGVKDTEVGRVWRQISDLLYDLAPDYKNR